MPVHPHAGQMYSDWLPSTLADFTQVPPVVEDARAVPPGPVRNLERVLRHGGRLRHRVRGHSRTLAQGKETTLEA
jgi:hypothetical protein